MQFFAVFPMQLVEFRASNLNILVWDRNQPTDQYIEIQDVQDQFCTLIAAARIIILEPSAIPVQLYAYRY